MTERANGSAGDLNRWQRKVFWTVWITYFAYYLCRYNMPVAKTTLCEAYSWSATKFGLVFSALTLTYAVGQFVNGQLADRFGSRAIASLGILVSVVMNLAIFLLLLVAPPGALDPQLVLWLLIVFWAVNGFFQSMGWPSMVRLMAHWVPVRRRGKVMGAMGTCYLFGNAFTWLVAVFLTGYFVRGLGGDWRSVFLVPAVMFALVGLFFFLPIRNRPEDVGLPAVDVERKPSGESHASSGPTIVGNVLRTLRNPYLWIVAGAFFMLDVTRYGFVHWLPDYLGRPPGVEFGLEAAEHGKELMATFKTIVKVCILPLGGVPGMLLAGWATDKFFGGRRAPVIVVLLILLGATSIAFPFIDRNNTGLVVAVVALVGFCTYGPHILMVGHAAQDFGKKSGAGGAAGFIDAMGYIGATLTGVGAGALIDSQGLDPIGQQRGYEIAFVTFGSAAILGALLTCLIWKVGPNTDGARPARVRQPMDARRRVALALDYKEPDRVPIDYWATSTVDARLRDHFGLATQEELLAHLDVDFRYIDGPKYIGPEPVVHGDGSVEDHWGVPRVRVAMGSGGQESVYQEVLHFPLKHARSVDEIRDYPNWPSPDWFDYDGVAGQVAEARRTGKVVVFMGDRMNRCAQLKPAMYLRGIDQILLDLALAPDVAEYLFQRIADFYREYARRTFEAAGGGIDLFMTGDDFGTQKGPFMSPDMWRRFLRPGFKAFVDLGHEYGAKVAHHSCGSIRPIIPDLIECGLDVLNPVQPDVADMDRAELKRRFGDRLSFHGSISIQRTLPFGTPDDVRREVQNRMETLAPGGGFIFCTAHNIQADTPTENIVALFDAYRTLGRY